MCDDCARVIAERKERIAPVADECVARGIAHLDEKGPANWRDLLNLDTLNIWSPESCVAGQVFAAFANNPDFQIWDSWQQKYLGMFLDGYEYWSDQVLPKDYSSGWFGFNSFYSEEDDASVTPEDMEDAWRRALQPAS